MTPSLRTFAALEAARRQTTLNAVSPTGMAILAGFALQWRDDSDPITVLNAMRMFKNISPSTVHRHLKKLRDLGLVAVTTDKIDTRTKNIVPTPTLLGALKHIEDALAQCEVAA